MDKKEALKIVKKDHQNFHNLPTHFKKDKKIVLEAVKQNGILLEFVDDSFMKDKEFVLEAVKEKPSPMIAITLSSISSGNPALIPTEPGEGKDTKFAPL